jgi:hypothetical protein
VTVSVGVPAHAGQGHVTAAYHGNTRFTASTSSPVTVTVT